MEKTINQTVQNTLNSLEKDCEVITEAIADTLTVDRWGAGGAGFTLGSHWVHTGFTLFSLGLYFSSDMV